MTHKQPPTHPAQQRVLRHGAEEVALVDEAPAGTVYYLHTANQRAEFLRYRKVADGYTVCNEKYLGGPDEAAHTYHMREIGSFIYRTCPGASGARIHTGRLGNRCYHAHALSLVKMLRWRERTAREDAEYAAAEAAQANAILAAGQRALARPAIP